MNVLLTSSGRRTYLVEYFREALKGKGLVFASNSVMCPAMAGADGYGISPLIYSGEYIPWLLKFCREHEIGLVVPLFDIDLPVLARERKKFEEQGVVLAVSSLDTVLTANDKLAMSRRLAEAGIGCPRCTSSPEEASEWVKEGHPVMIKPRFGCGSIGLYRADDEEELRVLYRKCRRAVKTSYLRYESAPFEGDEVLLQEFLSGTEYGLDVICDFEGRYRETVVRRKEAMRSGETDEAVILGESDPGYAQLKELGRKFSEIFEIRGNMDVDVLMDPAVPVPHVIDINARFGGGYPFSHAAGVDLPAAYIAWAEGKREPEMSLSARAGVHGYKDISVKVYG